jgi:hypothetical protein
MRRVIGLACAALLAAGCLGTADRAAAVRSAHFRLVFSPATDMMTGATIGPPAAGRSVRCPSPLCRTITRYLRRRPHGSRGCVGMTTAPAQIAISGRAGGRAVDAVVRPQCMSAGSPAITRMVRAIYAAATGLPQVTVAKTSSG